jgi:hypothetical protein
LEDATAHALSRPRDEASADIPDRDSVADIDAPVDGAAADSDARSDELANPIDHRLGRSVPLPIRRPILVESMEEPMVRTSTRSRRHERASRLSSRRRAHDLEPTRTTPEDAAQVLPEESGGDAAPSLRRIRNPRAVDPDAARRHDAFNELNDPRCAFSVRRRGRAVIYTARCPSEPRRYVGRGAPVADDQDSRLQARDRAGNTGAGNGARDGATGSVGASASADADVRSDTKRAVGDASVAGSPGDDDADASVGGSTAK